MGKPFRCKMGFHSFGRMDSNGMNVCKLCNAKYKQPAPREEDFDSELYDPKLYDERRVIGRINWYHSRAVRNKKKFHRSQIIIIGAGALIPIVNVVNFAPDEIRLISSILAGIVLGFTGFLQLRRYQENWILYRSTGESIRREYYFYKNKVGPYSDIKDDEQRKKVLVERVEDIIASENNRFLITHRQKPKP